MENKFNDKESNGEIQNPEFIKIYVDLVAIDKCFMQIKGQPWGEKASESLDKILTALSCIEIDTEEKKKRSLISEKEKKEINKKIQKIRKGIFKCEILKIEEEIQKLTKEMRQKLTELETAPRDKLDDLLKKIFGLNQAIGDLEEFREVSQQELSNLLTEGEDGEMPSGGNRNWN